MLVKFRKTWFAPSLPIQVDKIRQMSGQRFKAGEHEVAEEYRDILPKDAVIMEEYSVIEKQRELTLREADLERAAADAERIAMEKAQEQSVRMEKARAAKAAKRAS